VKVQKSACAKQEADRSKSQPGGKKDLDSLAGELEAERYLGMEGHIPAAGRPSPFVGSDRVVGKSSMQKGKAEKKRGMGNNIHRKSKR